jgi:hypothetical protein
MSLSLDALEAQVAKNIEVEASAIVLIQGIADALKAAGADPAKLAELQTALTTSAASRATGRRARVGWCQRPR